MLGNKAEYDRMADAEGTHWWYSSLQQRVLKTIYAHFPSNKEIEILDAGCGTGGLMLFLQKNGYTNLRGFDISEFAEAACRGKNLSVFKASLTETARYFHSDSMDVIICCDALYFLTPEEQKKTLADFYQLLKPGGIMILNLPSLKIFRGTHDLSVGIKQRYNHKMLTELLPEPVISEGYDFRYWPVLASPAIAIVRAFQRIKINSGKYSDRSDIYFPGHILNDLLKRLMNLELNFLPPVNFGSSLFVIAKKANIER